MDEMSPLQNISQISDWSEYMYKCAISKRCTATFIMDELNAHV